MKKFYAAAAALAMVVFAGAIATAPAGAAAAVVTCAKPSGFVTFTPGLSSTPAFQTTKFNLPVKGCTGSGGVKSGTSSGSSKGTKKSTCLSFATAGSQTTKVTIKWTPTSKGSSTASLATKVVPGAKGTITATVSGKITAGTFKGKTIKTEVKVVVPPGACTSKPLKKATLTGLAPLTIS